MKPPKVAAMRPTFGIGVVIGALILLGSQMSGSDPAIGLVLGGGAGIALGLTRRGGAERLAPAAIEMSGEAPGEVPGEVSIEEEGAEESR